MSISRFAMVVITHSGITDPKENQNPNRNSEILERLPRLHPLSQCKSNKLGKSTSTAAPAVKTLLN
jgi:hypothetical protein